MRLVNLATIGFAIVFTFGIVNPAFGDRDIRDRSYKVNKRLTSDVVVDSDPSGSKLVGEIVHIADGGQRAFTTLEFPHGGLARGMANVVASLTPSGFDLLNEVLYDQPECTGNPYLRYDPGRIFASLTNSEIATVFGPSGPPAIQLWVAPFGTSMTVDIHSASSRIGIQIPPSAGTDDMLRVDTRVDVELSVDDSIRIDLAGGVFTALSLPILNDLSGGGVLPAIFLISGGGIGHSNAVWRVTGDVDGPYDLFEVLFDTFDVDITDTSIYSQTFTVSTHIAGNPIVLQSATWPDPPPVPVPGSIVFCKPLNGAATGVLPATLMDENLHESFVPPFDVLRKQRW